MKEELINVEIMVGGLYELGMMKRRGRIRLEFVREDRYVRNEGIFCIGMILGWLYDWTA